MAIYQPGDMLLNKYRIERLLGRGAFGEIYLATHVKLKTQRALKVLRKDVAGVGSTVFTYYQDRFELEAALGARLNHPNVIQVFDFDQAGDELVLSMEYAPGGSLLEMIERSRTTGQPLGIPEILKIARDLALGLAALHSHDIVHRDLKPSNILLAQDGSAKLADLGVAQTSEGGITHRTQIDEKTPHHPGTPAFMSPEQSNIFTYLTPASDIFSLGVVLYQALTLRNPKSLPPGTRLSSLRPDAPSWLDSLLASMLAEDPRARPFDGAALLRRLEAGASLESRPEPGVTSIEPATVADQTTPVARAAGPPQIPPPAAPIETVPPARPPIPPPVAPHAVVSPSPQPPAAAAKKGQVPSAPVWAGSSTTVAVPRETPAATPRPKPAARRAFPVAPVVLLGVLALAAVALFIWQPWAAPAPAAPQPTQAPEPTTATQAQGEPAPTPGELPPPEPPQCFMAGQEWFSPVDEMPMVCVPGGEFAMGSAAGDPFAFSDEIPLHPVYLDGFWIDKFEVTFGRYRKCVEAGDCTPPDAIAPGEDYPVFNVTWDQAAAYCSWAGRRLPKEAEWEKAARGSDGRPYPWGPMPAGTNRANFGKRIGTVLPVGRLVEGASPFGAQDMAGNVWEWTSSLFRPYPFDPEDGREDQDSQEPRSIRGGSWQVPEGLIRTAARERMLRFNSELDQGFRCAW